jgi:hypothetical protein
VLATENCRGSQDDPSLVYNVSKGLLGLFSRLRKRRGFHVFKKEIRKASCPRLQVFIVRKCPSRHKPGVHTKTKNSGILIL